MKFEDIVFEGKYKSFLQYRINSNEYWYSSYDLLRETNLYSVFIRFQELFPDHPTDTNTFIFLLQGLYDTPRLYSLVIWCTHFECDDYESIQKMPIFMEYAFSVLSNFTNLGNINKLDGNSEEIIIYIYEPKKDVIDLIKEKGIHGIADRKNLLPNPAQEPT
jgi:hypothetical protein